MTPRCSVFIAASLDGFIARTDGSIDWLDAAYPFGFVQSVYDVLR